jgi:vacuolar protein sorting-associated protein 35
MADSMPRPERPDSRTAPPTLAVVVCSDVAAAPPEDQARLLEEALGIVRAHAASMRRCIEKLQILDALKHASMMLAELRTSSLGPKHYYELCTHLTFLRMF